MRPLDAVIKGWSENDYRGRVGRMFVRDRMSSSVVCVDPDTSFPEALSYNGGKGYKATAGGKGPISSASLPYRRHPSLMKATTWLFSAWAEGISPA